MASRPIFSPCSSGDSLVVTEFIEFKWFPGMAESQKQKSIQSLHQAARDQANIKDCLEISSKSELAVGKHLSAFNLAYTNNSDLSYSVECLYQSSKVFDQGGPYRDIMLKSSLDAKRDPRLKNSGSLKHFVSQNGDKWALEPKTAFYDWTYINVLAKNQVLYESIMTYDCFTDIEFNPKKSINCQAYSVALFLSLHKRNLLNEALRSPTAFLNLVGEFVIVNANEDQQLNPRLI